MRGLVLVIVCFGIGILAAVFQRGGRNQAARATTVVTERSSCAGGPSSDLVVTLEPDSVVATDTGDTLSVRAGLQTTSSSLAAARYAFELVEDTGEAVVAPTISAPISLENSDAVYSTTFVTPPSLPDGFYLVRLTAVSVDSDESAAETLHTYFRVDGGTISLLTSDEWNEQSSINVARAI
jgi:hypothetical protein